MNTERDLQRGSDWPLGVTVLLLLIVLVGGPFLAFSYVTTHGELGDKPYYAALQQVEYESRANKDPSPLLRGNVDGTGIDVVGVLGRDAARTRVWVALNVTDSDGNPYVLPRGIEIQPDCAQLGRVVNGQRVKAEVWRFLFQGCAAG
jgi:hypothetical protein